MPSCRAATRCSVSASARRCPGPAPPVRRRPEQRVEAGDACRTASARSGTSRTCWRACGRCHHRLTGPPAGSERRRRWRRRSRCLAPGPGHRALERVAHRRPRRRTPDWSPPCRRTRRAGRRSSPASCAVVQRRVAAGAAGVDDRPAVGGRRSGVVILCAITMSGRAQVSVQVDLGRRAGVRVGRDHACVLQVVVRQRRWPGTRPGCRRAGSRCRSAPRRCG